MGAGMQLSLPELAQWLGLPESTVDRWIWQGRLPVRKKGDTCYFRKNTLKRWAELNGLGFGPPMASGGDKDVSALEPLVVLVERGGIHYDVEGNDIEGVLHSVVNLLSGIDDENTKEDLYQRLVSREEMMSTGIGNGIAIPHPRVPVADLPVPAQVAVCFLKNKIDYRAVDKKPVHTLFVVIAKTSRQHLHILSRVSYCLRDRAFLELIENRPDPDILIKDIAAIDHRLEQARE